MRTEPIDVYLKFPEQDLYGIQVIVSPESEEDAANYCAKMKYDCLSVNSFEDAVSAFKSICACPYVFIFVRGAQYETRFLNWIYDYLEENNGYKEIYIVPTKEACKVFSSVAKDIDFINPNAASTRMPVDGFGGLLDILDEMYDEAAYSEEEDEYCEDDIFEVGGNGGAWYKGEPVGMLFGIKKICYGKETECVDQLRINILEDKKYVPGVKIDANESISPSGYFRNNSANVFYDMSNIEPGTVSIIKYHVNATDKKCYYVMRPWQMFTVFTEKGSHILKTTTGAVPDECDIVMTRSSFPLNNALGILFARIGAGDARWHSDIVAEVSYMGHSIPITYVKRNDGGVTLNIGEFSIDDDNYFKYGTKQE